MKSRDQRSAKDSQRVVSLRHLPFSTRILFTSFLLLIGIEKRVGAIVAVLNKLIEQRKIMTEKISAHPDK